MTDGEARTWLGLGDTAAGPEDVRIAYLELRRRITLDSDPAVFIASRQAFETLRGTGAAQAQDDLLAARARLAEAPDSADARWTLLSQLGYSDGTEAFEVLRDGAERQPDEFADELLFHFAAKAPAAVLARARARALAPRMLVIADVHASQGRPAEALTALTEALNEARELSGAILQLAARPMFSLHARAHLDAARTAHDLIAKAIERSGLDRRTLDSRVGTVLEIGDELNRLGDSLPFELRQAAAHIARSGAFENASYEAHYATRLLSGRALRKWRKRLASEAPTLAKVLGLHLTEDELRPRGTPNFRISGGTGIAVLLTTLVVAWKIHVMRSQMFDIEEFTASLNRQFPERRAKTELEACADPSSDDCLSWQEKATCPALSLKDCARWRAAWMRRWRPDAAPAVEPDDWSR